MILRVYTIFLLPALVTIVLVWGLPDHVEIILSAPIGNLVGLQGSSMKASGPIALYMTLFLVTPFVYPPMKDDGLNKIRRKLCGKWQLVAWGENNTRYEGGARIQINRDNGRLFISGYWMAGEREIPWRAQQLHLDENHLSYVCKTFDPRPGTNSPNIRSLVDFDITDQPEFKKLVGTWHLVEGEGMNRIELHRA